MTAQKITINKIAFEIAPFNKDKEYRKQFANFNLITPDDVSDPFTAFSLEIEAAKVLNISAPFFVKFEYVK